MENRTIKMEMLPCSDKRYSIFLAFFFLLCFHANAQNLTKKEKAIKKKADNAYDMGDYLNASTLYKTLILKDSLNPDINYKLGVSYFELKRFRKEALPYFERTSTSKYPETFYYLGRLYHLHRKFEKAIACYNSYLKNKTVEEPDHTAKEINDLIAKSNNAMIFESQIDKSVQVNNLGEDVNTIYSEYAPLIPADESFILFTSRRENNIHKSTDVFGDYFEDIYISKKQGTSKWSSPAMLDISINTDLHDACTGLSADGERLLIYRTSKDLRSGDIYQSNLINSNWTTPIMLDNNINSEKFIEPSACYSPDGETIIFSSNREGGYGGLDLYMLKKLPNGHWGEPKNLGPTINTEYNEDSPFIHPLGNALYFSSEGHKNMGGYDIFRSNFDENGVFSTPENLGCPINTTDDDIFFVMNTNADRGYFSSEREGGYGQQDIYTVSFSSETSPLEVFNVYAIDQNDSIAKKVTLTLVDLSTKSVHGVYKSNENTGKILVISQPNKEYKIIIEGKGYTTYSTTTILKKEKEIIFKVKKEAQ